MSILNQATGKADVWEDAKAATAELLDRFPNLVELLRGKPQKGDDPGVYPCSVRIFSNGKQLRAQISGKEWLWDFYVDIPSGVDVLEGLENQLKAGKFGKSASTEQKNASRKLPY